MPEFLFEIGLEEIPARMIAAAERELARRVEEMLVREHLISTQAEQGAGGAVQSFSTPRRLAVVVSGVRERQADLEEQILGPATKVAFKDGQPTAAAHAFAKKAGVAVDALKTIQSAKGEYVAADIRRTGKSAPEVIAAHLPAELAAISWSKSMYWRPGKPERFVRPVRWMVALLEDAIVPVEFAGVTSSNISYGHRVLTYNAAVTIILPRNYATLLHAAKVEVDPEARRHSIRKALDAATRAVSDARWREDEALVDAVVHLTEWPSVVLGSFEQEFLRLPEEVLVTVMRDHQKYFAVEDADGKLAPHFLAVLNTEPNAAGAATIVHGNERVLRARFNDARFFWNVDQKIPLVHRVEMLKSVTFQKDLGTYWDKTDANSRVAAALAELAARSNAALNTDALMQAAQLAKTDLTTELVKEFTELQGIVGGLYARAQGHPEAVWKSIYSQYRPAGSSDPIPETTEGQLLGLADRIHTIVEMFAIGLQPTGSKDPFALRRAGNAIIRILAESDLSLTLAEIQMAAASQIKIANEEKSSDAVRSFLKERLEFYLREARDFSYDVVAAVLASDADHVGDAIARAEAVTDVRGSEDFTAIAGGFKRMKNILRQAAEKNIQPSTQIDPGKLVDIEEQALYRESRSIAAAVEILRADHKYSEALEKIATLRPAVDAFFDKVMVMAPDAELRGNRLALLGLVLGDFSRVADFSEIAS